MEILCTSETFFSRYQSTRRPDPEENKPNRHETSNLTQNAFEVPPKRLTNTFLLISVYSLFNDVVSSLDYVQRRMIEWLVMIWKGFGRKPSLSNLRYHPNIYLEGLSKGTKILSQGGQSPCDIWTKNVPKKTGAACVRLRRLIFNCC
jgi:hypothetical protein